MDPMGIQSMVSVFLIFLCDSTDGDGRPPTVDRSNQISRPRERKQTCFIDIFVGVG